jgi:phospholipid/cholesterol/gamma-HCH transport system substrate-binding protein
VGPDGRAYSESDLAFTSKGKTWQSMMVPPKKPSP